MNNHIKLAVRETESVAVVTFDRMNSGANIFDIASGSTNNPNGVAASSPGLRVFELPWEKNEPFLSPSFFHNPERVAASVRFRLRRRRSGASPWLETFNH